MSFESRMVGFARRFLSGRTYQLIVMPAIADLQFERRAGPMKRAANHFGVFRAIIGGVGDDVARASGSFFTLMLLPSCYYLFLLVLCFDVFSISLSTDFVVVAALILILSFAPVLACFWPERTTRTIE